MALGHSKRYAVCYCLKDLIDEEISYEDACNFLPLFRLVNPDSGDFKSELTKLSEFYEIGCQLLKEIFMEQRKHEEPLYKTLFMRSQKEDTRIKDCAFFKMIDLQNAHEPAETIWEYFALSFDKLARETRNGMASVYIGECERCGIYYPIRRIQHGALAKNHFCENCRNSMASLMNKEEKRTTPLYIEHEKLYNRYYQQYKRTRVITHQEFKEIIKITGEVRDDFLNKGITDGRQYIKEVEKKVREFRDTRI